MTTRMEDFRLRQKAKGLVQIRLWVNEEDADFFKYLSKYSRPERELIQKERYGRPATSQHIEKAKEVAERKGLKEPKHLYNHHLSLCGWIRGNSGGSFYDYEEEFSYQP